MVQQNRRVLKFAVILLMAALVFLAGCMTMPQESTSQESLPQNWSINAQTNAPILSATNTAHVTKTQAPPKTNLPPAVHANLPPVQSKPILTWTSLNRWAAENQIGPPVHLTSSPPEHRGRSPAVPANWCWPSAAAK